jgi:uncharacterized protein YjbI with pentapeptide repeats
MTVKQLARIAAAGAALFLCAAFVLAQDGAPTVADNVKRLKDTRECQRCDLRGADLTSANLYGARLQGANLEGAILTDANLELANLTGAIGANFDGARTDKRTICPSGAAGPCR